MALSGVESALVWCPQTCMLADALSMASRLAANPGAARASDTDGWVAPITAVDVSSDRLKVARNIMGKYGISVVEYSGAKHGHDRGRPAVQQPVVNRTDVSVRLFCEDGTQFNEAPPAPPAKSAGTDYTDDGHGEPDSTEKNALPDNTPPLCGRRPPAGPLYNRILVDAECTHDGSLKHIAKFANQWGWSTFERRVPWLAPEKIAEVTGLQRALLWNGFRLLEPCRDPSSPVHGAEPVKVASSLIYSTCSLSRSQNEDIVSWLLSAAPTARVVPIDQDDCRIRLYGKSDECEVDHGADHRT
jgi:16S rRNA C967 or C1407 C5-methylase (RsmB/RsmF family)